MNSYELYLPQIPKKVENTKREYRATVQWPTERIEYLVANFPTKFNKDIAAELGCGWRTVIRKARELGLEKEPGFLDKNRTEIVRRIFKVRVHNPLQSGKGYFVPNSEQYRFKPGNIPATVRKPEVAQKARATRNETIRRERIRLTYGLPPLTKLNIKV